MAIADRVSVLNKKVESIVKSESLKIYEKVTGINRGLTQKMVADEIIQKEKEAKEKGDSFSEDYRSDEYVNKKTDELFYSLVQEKLTKEGLSIGFEEVVEDGKDYLEFTVTKDISKIRIGLSFDYTLNVGDTLKVEGINKNKGEFEKTL